MLVNLDEIVAFIAPFQVTSETAFGSVGDTPAEIMADLTEYGVTFEVERTGDELIGVIGVDIDPELGRAWIHGPFVAARDWDAVADRLWSRVADKLQSPIKQAEIAYDEANVQAAEFAQRHGFKPFSIGALMALQRLDATDAEPEMVEPYRDEFASGVIALHEQEFPNRWITGKQMIERVTSQRQIFVAQKNGMVLGYGYAEARPEVPDCTIEFIGVAPSARGRGIGTALLRVLVGWLLSFSEIDEIALFVRDDNVAARRIYEKAGFHPKQRLVGVRKEPLGSGR